MEEQFDEDSEDQRKIKIIGIYKTLVSKEPSENLMNQ